MAASSNESFGLKIATAFSIALTVVLLVVVYFLNSNYSLETANRIKIEADLIKANRGLSEAQSRANDYRGFLGYPVLDLDDLDAVKALMKKDQDLIRADIQQINTDITTMIGEFQKKAEAKGVDVTQLEALKQRAREVADLYLNNTDQSYKAMVTRLKDLTVNQAKLTTALALNYIDVRRDLELANKINSEGKKVVEDGLAAAKAELDATIKKDEETRQSVVDADRKKAEELAAKDVQMTNLINDNTTKKEQLEKRVSQLLAFNRDLNDQKALKEDVMIKPGGRVTFVDYSASQIRMNVNRSQGIRPLMRFTIFDKNAVGLASDKPKAVVEIIKVGDPQRGENDSQARIVQTVDPAQPIRYNDLIYSVGWSYDHPQRFALIGKLDLNRDGRDDRADLIRMIEASGGVVEYDLPPPNADRGPGQAAVARAFTRLGQPMPQGVGRASGKISGLAYGYVTDSRPTLILYAKKEPEGTKIDAAYLKEESDATKEARDNGVRPLPLEKLLNLLGYDFAAPIEGRREVYDKGGVNQLLKGRKKSATTPPPTDPTGTAPPADSGGVMPDAPK